MTERQQLLTQSEVKRITGLSRAQMRYWRRALSDLAGKGGRKPCFTPAEAFALKVLAWLNQNLKCEVAVLEYASSTLFAMARAGGWLRLEHQWMVLWPTESSVRFQYKTEEPVEGKPELAILVDLAPHVKAVRNYLLGVPEKPDTRQRDLPFEPSSLQDRQGSGGSVRERSGG